MPNGMPQGIQGVVDTIVALRDQQLCIIKCIDGVYLGTRKQAMGIDQDYPPVVLPAAAYLVIISFEVRWAFFNELWEA